LKKLKIYSNLLKNKKLPNLENNKNKWKKKKLLDKNNWNKIWSLKLLEPKWTFLMMIVLMIKLLKISLNTPKKFVMKFQLLPDHSVVVKLKIYLNVLTKKLSVTHAVISILVWSMSKRETDVPVIVMPKCMLEKKIWEPKLLEMPLTLESLELKPLPLLKEKWDSDKLTVMIWDSDNHKKKKFTNLLLMKKNSKN